MISINKKISSGVLWNLLSLFMTRGASTIFTLFLARLLAPEAFGLIAMATIVFELANTFVDSGFGIALIRSKSITSSDLNTVFYSNILFSTIAYILVFISAPYIAEFYNQIELTLLIRLMGLIVFINATKIVQTSIFNRDMDFKSLMKSNTLSVIISGILGVLAAWYGMGVWSLVIQSLSASCISALVLWHMSSWRPKLEFDLKSFTNLFQFSKSLLAEGLIDVIFRNSYVLVIGRLFNAEITGLYFFANKINELVSQQLTSAVQQATLPALSTMQDENAKLRSKYRVVIQLTMFLIAPIMALLAGLAPIFIPLFFGSNWGDSVFYLQLLCIVGALYPLHAINVNLLLVKGKSDLLFKIGLIKRAVSLILLCLSIPYGVVGIIIGQIITSFFSLLPNTYYSAKLINYSFLSQFKDSVKPIISAIFAGLISGIYIMQAQSDYFLWLISGTMLGLITYLFSSYILKSEGLVILYHRIKIALKLYKNIK